MRISPSLSAMLLSCSLASTASGVTLTVTADNFHGWQASSTGTASGAFVAGPGTPPAGSGSYQFAIGADGASTAALGQPAHANVPLKLLLGLSYSTNVSQQGAAGQAPFVSLDIDQDKNGSIDDTIVFAPPSAAVALGTWQTWDAGVGTWQSGDLGAGSLGAYLVAFPNATIGASGLNVGVGAAAGGWANFVGAVTRVQVQTDCVIFNYNFEGTGPAPANGVPAPAAAWGGIALMAGLGVLRRVRRRHG